MFSPVSPEFVHIIHQDKVRELEREIELARIAKEQRSLEAGSAVEQRQTWYAQTSQWIKEKLFSRVSASERPSSQPETIAEPCTGVPC